MLQIKIPTIEDTQENHATDSCVASVYTHINNGDRKILDVLRSTQGLGELTPGINIHYYSDGAFSFINLIDYIITQVDNPVHIFLCSYSISVSSIRHLKRLIDKGIVLSIQFLIDNRVRSISPKNFDELIGTFPNAYRCTSLHAKVCLIYNADWNISIVGSQNLTKNPKLERGIIHIDPSIFDYDYEQLTNAYESGTT